MNFSDAFKIGDSALKAASKSLFDGEKNTYFVRAPDGSPALRFNGFRVSETKLELLLDGEPVAEMPLPELFSGDTLTIDARDSIIATYKFTLTGA